MSDVICPTLVALGDVQLSDKDAQRHIKEFNEYQNKKKMKNLWDYVRTKNVKYAQETFINDVTHKEGGGEDTLYCGLCVSKTKTKQWNAEIRTQFCSRVSD